MLGLSHSLVDEMTKRVEDIEKENDVLRKWMETEHAATQEKISLLTEATFAITNMLAGVQASEATPRAASAHQRRLCSAPLTPHTTHPPPPPHHPPPHRPCTTPPSLHRRCITPAPPLHHACIPLQGIDSMTLLEATAGTIGTASDVLSGLTRPGQS